MGAQFVLRNGPPELWGFTAWPPVRCRDVDLTGGRLAAA
jgi:hypothetical protein